MNSDSAIQIFAKNIVVAVATYFKLTVFDRVDFIREYMEPFVCKQYSKGRTGRRNFQSCPCWSETVS